MRQLLHSPAFMRMLKRILRKSPHSQASIQIALATLQANPFDPELKTHKLKGKMAGVWASTVAYDLRIVFVFSKNQPEDDIQLLSIGTHDDVY